MTRVFDLSAWGRLAAEGADAADFLDRLLSQDLRGAPDGSVRRACLLDEKGRIVLLLDVVRLSPASFLLLADPGGADRMAEAIGRYLVADDVRLAPHPGRHVHLTGAAAAGVLGRLGLPVPAPGAAAVAGGVVVAAVDRTGTPGWDLVGGPDAAACAAAGAASAAEADLETARIAAGIPRLGREIDDATFPAEVGLERACVTTKCYVGQEVVARIESRGRTHRRLARLALEGAAAGAGLLLGGEGVGRITSAAGGRGLALVETGAAAPGTRLEVDGGGAATVL